MLRITILIIASLILSLIQSERGEITLDSLAFLILSGFSFAIFLNIINNKKIKFGLFLISIIFVLIFPRYSFLLILLALSAYDNFGKSGALLFIPLIGNFQNANFLLGVLVYLFGYIITTKEIELAKLKEEKLNLIEDVNNLYRSIDVLKIEREREETLALQDERNRISREIHDTAGHTLSASILNLKALSLISKEEQVKEGILHLKENLEKGLVEIRNVMYDLREASFDLENKILELLESVENSNFTYIIQTNLSYGIKYDIYGIVREALTNFIKHSNGENFKVYLVENEKFIVLKIDDDGTVNDENITEGMGIYSIKKKCNERNWKLNLLTKKGFGIHILMEKSDENISSR